MNRLISFASTLALSACWMALPSSAATASATSPAGSFATSAPMASTPAGTASTAVAAQQASCFIPEAVIVETVTELTPDSFDPALMERGVRACAALWRDSDGSPEDFKAFILENYERTPEKKQVLFEHLSKAFEALAGCSNDLTIRLQRPTVLAGDEPHNVDYILSGFNGFSHLNEDMFANRIAFITALNFPFYSLAEKNALGPDWDSTQWGYARMGDKYTQRIPASVVQNLSTAMANGENYVAAYNIKMGHLLTEDGRRLFPEDMSLLSHWNLRDEIKANYADVPDAAEKQEMIFKVMQRIVDQSIPLCVINNPDYDWKPYSNTVWKDGKQVTDAPSEGNRRYARILDQFHANQAADLWQPQMPTAIIRNFEGDMEVGADEIENLFVRLISSDEVKEVARYISKQLGRDLRPYDIWYDGFKSRSTMSEDSLTAQTRALYPDAQAFKADMPRILRNLGFSDADADYIAGKIEVEGARGSGHAWPAESTFQPSLLRTRIGADGMDYKGYNIAVHEMGHNVEETLNMYYSPNFMIARIPNNALTETMAFIFQKRDLQHLGYPTAIDDNVTLDIFWGEYEIMGVALTDMYTWRWLYDHPDATADELRDAVNRIAADVWNKYYEPVLGTPDCTLLAIYSHMINTPMYLPNYPYGHLVEYQMEEYLSQYEKAEDFAAQLKRIWSQGRLTPDVWMHRAVGAPVSAEPLIRAASKAIKSK